MSEKEIDAYMNTFRDMEDALKHIEDEHRKSDKMPKQDFGPRLAQFSVVQKLMIKQLKMIGEQLTRMNNIFTAQASDPEPITDAVAQ